MSRRCKLFGHRLAFTPAQRWNARRGRWVGGNRCYCERCHVGEPAVFQMGVFESVCMWPTRLKWWLLGLFDGIRARRNPPTVTFNDEDIPF